MDSHFFFRVDASAGYGARIFLHEHASDRAHAAAKAACVWGGSDKRWGAYLGYELTPASYYRLYTFLVASLGLVEVSPSVAEDDNDGRM